MIWIFGAAAVIGGIVGWSQGRGTEGRILTALGYAVVACCVAAGGLLIIGVR